MRLDATITPRVSNPGPVGSLTSANPDVNAQKLVTDAFDQAAAEVGSTTRSQTQ
jgi:hypothetical protein